MNTKENKNIEKKIKNNPKRKKSKNFVNKKKFSTLIIF